MMQRNDWTQQQVQDAIEYIREHYKFISAKYPSNIRENKEIFAKIQNKYENMFCKIIEIYKLVNNTYEYKLFCPVCGKRNAYQANHCSYRCTQLDKEVRAKQAATNLLLYNNAKYNNPAKNKQTCLERYGVVNVFQRESIKEKSKKTKLNRYGNENYTNPEKQRLTKLLDIDEQGLNAYQRATLKSQNTMLERYNVKTPMESEEFKNNLEKAMLKKYNVKNIFQLDSVRKKITKHNSSYKEKVWLDNMGVPIGKANRQVYNNRFIFDGFYNNCVYEFLGDFYHGNPKALKRYTEQTQCKYKEYYREVFIKTKKRFDKIKDLGFKIYYCWESDFSKDNKFYREYNGKLEY